MQSIQGQIEGLSVDQYSGTTANLYARWEVYKTAKRPVDFYQATFELLHLDDAATVLDIGCADGKGLMSLREDYGHSGNLIGVDIDADLFYVNTVVPRIHNLEPVNFVVASAESLPLADNSVDASLAMFMLYHVPRPEVAISELARVTKPDGDIVIATSGKGNKPKHRQFEQAIADYLDIDPPPIFSEKFDFDVAARTLPLVFDVLSEFHQFDAMQITEDNIEIYLGSLTSMKNAFSEHISIRDWNTAIESIVLPAIRAEIAKKGAFTDRIERHLYLCKNNLHISDDVESH